MSVCLSRANPLYVATCLLQHISLTISLSLCLFLSHSPTSIPPNTDTQTETHTLSPPPPPHTRHESTPWCKAEHQARPGRGRALSSRRDGRSRKRQVLSAHSATILCPCLPFAVCVLGVSRVCALAGEHAKCLQRQVWSVPILPCLSCALCVPCLWCAMCVSCAHLGECLLVAMLPSVPCAMLPCVPCAMLPCVPCAMLPCVPCAPLGVCVLETRVLECL